MQKTVMKQVKIKDITNEQLIALKTKRANDYFDENGTRKGAWTKQSVIEDLVAQAHQKEIG